MSNLRFEEAGHRYVEDEVEIPTLSRVLELSGLRPDDSRVPLEVLMFAQRRGKAVHKAIALHLEDSLDWDSVGEDVYPQVRAALDYLEREERKLIEWETPRGGGEVGFACTPDLVVEDGVVEWKTTSAIYPEVAIQLMGQVVALDAARPQDGTRLLFDKNGHRKFDHERRVVHLKKDGTYKIKDFVDHDGDHRVMEAALRIAQWRLDQ